MVGEVCVVWGGEERGVSIGTNKQLGRRYNFVECTK